MGSNSRHFDEHNIFTVDLAISQGQIMKIARVKNQSNFVTVLGLRRMS